MVNISARKITEMENKQEFIFFWLNIDDLSSNRETWVMNMHQVITGRLVNHNILNNGRVNMVG